MTLFEDSFYIFTELVERNLKTYRHHRHSERRSPCVGSIHLNLASKSLQLQPIECNKYEIYWNTLNNRYGNNKER